MPTAEACAGRTTPVRLPTRTDRGLSTQSMNRTEVPSSTARLAVSWVCSRSCSSTGPGDAPDVDAADRGEPDLVERRARPVGAVRPVLRHEPAPAQRREQPVRGRPGDAEQVGGLGDAQGLALTDQLQQPQRVVDRRGRRRLRQGCRRLPVGLRCIVRHAGMLAVEVGP